MTTSADTVASEPIPMLLFCPKCGTQHIDAPEDHEIDKGSHVDIVLDWANPPHKSHLCHTCGNIWRPADIETTGVASIKTKGKADTWDSTAPTTGSAPVAWLVTSKRGMVRVAWTDKPSDEQIAISEYDGDTITPLYGRKMMTNLKQCDGSGAVAVSVDDWTECTACAGAGCAEDDSPPALPIAWMLETPGQSTRWYTSGRQAMEHWVNSGAISTPLYAAPPANAPVASVLTDACIDEVMSQAQVFASAWSMVGGPFDFGDALETAEVEKVNLRALLAASMGGGKA